jgi:hypothetical protein
VDVEAAQACNDYVSLVLDGRNDGFTILHDWIKDALITRVGACKFFWEQEDGPVKLYEGLTPEEVEQAGAELVSEGLWAVQEPRGRVRIESFPVEELYITATARDVSRAPIVAHGRLLTISEIRKLGYDVNADVSDSGEEEDDLPEARVRDRGDVRDEDDMDPLSREVMFFEGFTPGYHTANGRRFRLRHGGEQRRISRHVARRAGGLPPHVHVAQRAARGRHGRCRLCHFL